MAISWTVAEPELGMQPILETSTTQRHPLGKIVQAYAVDTTTYYGQGEFIYLLGVANTVVGLLVTYDTLNPQIATVLSPTAGSTGRPVAVAMSANVASQWGWYQIGGTAIIKKTAVKVSPAVALFQSGTAGRVMSTVSSGKQFAGMRSVNAATVASATSTITAVINRPAFQALDNVL